MRARDHHLSVIAQEIREDCCKAQAESGQESSGQAAVTRHFVKQLAGNHIGYEALLHPLTLSAETPHWAVLFQQCLLAISAPKVHA